MGSGNVGAVGVRLRGAQGSGLEDVTVDVGPGLVGVVGGCGSGGAHHGVHVIGGRYGLDLRQSQPTGTVSGITLEQQRCAAIIYSGFESLSAVREPSPPHCVLVFVFWNCGWGGDLLHTATNKKTGAAMRVQNARCRVSLPQSRFHIEEVIIHGSTK